MPMHVIEVPGLPPPIAPYSAGTVADGIVYVSGTLSLAADGTVAYPGDAAAQTRQVLHTIRSVIEAAGGTIADVTFNHVFLSDWADYAAVNAVYGEFFPGLKPARYCVQCGLVKPGLLVEIASVAHVGRG